MIEKFCSAIRNMVIALIFIVTLCTGAMILFFHIKPYIVLSGSMEPTIQTGSICFINERNIDLELNDVICYKSGDMNITHRVVEITNGGYVTKGDNNDTRDFGLVRKNQIQGTTILHIPYLGYIVMFLKTPQGVLMVLIGFVVFSIIGWYLGYKGRKKSI